MKRIVLIVSAALLAAPLFAWNKTGHTAIAQIAEDHVSRKTKKALDKYLDGMSITDIASYPDKYYYEWTRDIGWECSNPSILRRKPSELDVQPTNIEPWCHSFTVDSLCNCYHHNREGDVYVRNAVMDIDQVAGELKNNIKNMPPEEIKVKIAVVVHLVGDFHCPFHTLYVPQAPTGGKYSIYLGEKKYNIHSFWDSVIFNRLNKEWSYTNYAEAADTATKDEIAEIVKGDIYDWASRSAKDVLPAHNLEPGQYLPLDYPESMRWLVYQQLRNGGYRLARLLDYIFDGTASGKDTEIQDLPLVPSACSKQ